jgi:copper transport protein
VRRLLAAAGLVAVLLLVGAIPAAAHAELVAASPSDGAHVDTAPDVVRLEFSEPVSADLGGLRVYESSGDRVDEGAVRTDGNVVEVGLQGGLGDGAYVATYRIVSADGHPVQGGLVFSVGDADADPALLSEFFDEGADRPWEVAGAVFRFLAYAGALLAAGGAAFLVLVHDGGEERPRLRRIVRVGAAVGAVGVLAALPIQAALATGEGLGAIFQDGVLSGVLEEGVGWSTLVILIGLVLVITLLDHVVPTLIGAAMASAGFALSGHTRSADHELLAVGADKVHLLAAAVWFGGVVLLAVVLRARRAETAESGPRASAVMVARFSTVAAVAVGVLTVAGLALTWSEVGSLDALTSTTYGWTLLAKVGVAVLVGLAAVYNHFRLVPVVRRAPAPRAWHQLRSSLRVEALGLVAVLALTAVLVNVTPARTAAGGEVFSGDIDLGDDGSVNVVVDPNQAGSNQIHVYFYDRDGRPAEVPDDAEVTIGLSLPADDIGPIRRTPFRAGPSHFQLDSNDLVTGGRWLVEVGVRSRFEEAGGEIEVLVAG